MRDHMQEPVPDVIIQKCIAAAKGTPLCDIAEILQHSASIEGWIPGLGMGQKVDPTERALEEHKRDAAGG